MEKLAEKPIKPIKKGGVKEGFARALSQACVYPIETRKTLLQIGKTINIKDQLLNNHNSLQKIVSGMSTSCITAGIVFCIYFSIYNTFKPSIFAGSIASITTSIIKLPFGNSIRIMQCGSSSNIFNASKQLYKNNGFAGLYNGYGLCLVEDIIDMELRVRLYNGLQNIHSKVHNKIILNSDYLQESVNPLTCIGYGSISGALSCGITTPFDTVRARMCFNTAKNAKESALAISKLILLNEGIRGFYTGAPLRITSNAVRSGLFFSFLNMMNSFN
jgi:solute carrier family 25 iron transporter 28/37